jgi:outer membrane protein
MTSVSKFAWVLALLGLLPWTGCRNPYGLACCYVPYCLPDDLRSIDPLELDSSPTGAEEVVPPEGKAKDDATEATRDRDSSTSVVPSVYLDNEAEKMSPDGQGAHPTPAAGTGKSPQATAESESDSLIPDPQQAKVKLDIAIVRAAALKGNFELQVEMVGPSIARQQISEEAARFQTTFAVPISRNQIHPPPGPPGTFTRPALNNENTVFDQVRPTINVPLLSGGQFAITQGIDHRDAVLADAAYDTDLEFSFSQPLLRGAGNAFNTAGIRLARIQTTSTHARVKLAAIKVLADVERAYWNLYLAEREREIAEQQVEIAEKQVTETRRLIKAELFAEIDEQRALAGLYTRQAVLHSAQVEVRLANRELKRLMQYPQLPVESASEVQVVTQPQPKDLELDRKSLGEYALQNRMEMFRLQMELLANQITERVEANSRQPRVDLLARAALLGNGGTLHRSYEELFGSGATDWSVQLVGEIPLPNGINQAAEARRRQVVLQRLQLAITKDQLGVLIRQEVNDAIDRIELNWQRVLAAQNGVIASQKAYAGEIRQFQLGQRDSTDVYIAADRLALAQQQEVEAMRDFEVAKVDLAVATGTTLGFSQVHWTPLATGDHRS